MTYFTEHAQALNLFQNAGVPNEGFRRGQLGALHAVMAHFSMQEDPAIVCLPTGYGKTSLMMALPFMMAAKRVLIVEPTNPLRKQVYTHYAALSTLKRLKVIEQGCPLPNVHLHVGRPPTLEAWQVLDQYDVVVSTPGSSSPIHDPAAPVDLFDLVIFDEAHHAPADFWIAYLQHFTAARFVFLTATPFRRDGRVIPGKLIYRYPVVRALEEGAFVPITFRAAPVVNQLDDTHVDHVIAETAVAQLKEDIANGLDHRLFIRAATISAAQDLVPVYQGMGVAVEAISSRLTKKQQDVIEGKLIAGELEAIICVDMFGEGYDFPKLKVAALHAPHKSLVPTIQFIGRFARIDETTGTPTLVAPLFRVREATASLLKEGVNLAQMIDDAAHAQIQGDAEDQAFVETLPVRQIAESDYDSVSPLSLHLYAHVRIYQCEAPPDFSLLNAKIGNMLRVVKRWATDDGGISLVLTADEMPPRWAFSDALVDVTHEAFLLMYFPESRYCYIGATRRSEKLYLSIMEDVCPDGCRSLSYEETSRARVGLETVKFFNVGLKNTALNSQSETYRTLTGPQAERAVSMGDSRAYAQGHFFGSGMNGQTKETVGASSSSRVWSNQRLSIPDFVEWVQTLDGRIHGNAAFAETHLDIVRTTKRLQILPDAVIAAHWPKEGFKTNPRIRYRINPGGQYHYSKLFEWDLQDFRSHPQVGRLQFSVTHVEGTVEMLFALGQARMVTFVDPATCLDIEPAHEQWIPLSEWLCEHSPVFHAADKSSFEGMNLMAAPQLQSYALGPEDSRFIDWTGCEISVEFLPDKDDPDTRRKRAELAGAATVQEHLEQYLKTLPDVQAIFYDHRAGEAADYICISVDAHQHVNVDFYHCKGAGGPANGGRVSDVYEVAGQLVKSVYYCATPVLLEHMADRMHQRHTSPSKFVAGDLAATKALLESTPATKLTFTVIGVQPGICRSMVNERLSDLMGYCISYVRQGGAAGAYWLVNEIVAPQVGNGT